MASAYSSEEIVPGNWSPRCSSSTDLPRDDRGRLQALPGYVDKRNEVARKLSRRRSRPPRTPGLFGLPLAEGCRSLVREYDGIKDHEMYFERPRRQRRRAELRPASVTSSGATSARRRTGRGRPEGNRDGRPHGWAWTAYRLGQGRLFNHLGDAQNTFPDSGTRRRAHRARHVQDASSSISVPSRRRLHRRRFSTDLRLRRGERLGAAVQRPTLTGQRPVVSFAALVGARVFPGLVPMGILGRAARAQGHPKVGSGRHRSDERVAHVRALASASRRCCSTCSGDRAALLGMLLRLGPPPLEDHRRGSRRCSGTWRPLFLRFAKGGEIIATCGGDLFGVAVWVAAHAGIVLARSSS